MSNAKEALITRRTFTYLSATAVAALCLGGLTSCSSGGNGGEGGSVTAKEKTLSAEAKRELAFTRIVESMTLEEKIAQLFVVTPEALTGAETVTSAGAVTKASVEALPVGGVVYFAKNLIDPDQTKAMLANTLQYYEEAGKQPPFLAVDEEGGTVARIARNSAFGVESVGDMQDVGASGSTAEARAVGSTIAGYLKPLGFNLDFAPVCDIANNPNSDVMRRRAFGQTASEVSAMASACIEGFLEGGMLCSAKHFPGIGGALGDSHEVQITSQETKADLEAEELLPFKAAIQAGVPLVMVGHLSLPNITGSSVPSCLSFEVVTGILRETLGFAGVVITDSLTMNAVSDYYDAGEAAVRCLEAGCDVALMPEDLALAVQGVHAAVEGGRISQTRIDESVRRILRAKAQAMPTKFPKE